MRKLVVQQNQISYVGLFSKPAFSLWGEEAKILEGLYTTFAPYRISLANFHSESATQDPSDQAVAINFGPWKSYKFKFDRVEARHSNYNSDEELGEFPELLTKGETWLRSTAPALSFQTHLFTYSSHNKLSEGTSTDFLLSLSQVSIPSIGISRGNGIIFHWDIPDQKWQVQLTVDHSNIEVGGLFIDFAVISGVDRLDYTEALQEGKALLYRALENIALEFDTET